MRPLSKRTIFIFISRSLSTKPTSNLEIHQHGLRISHFSTPSNSFHSSPSSSSSSSSSYPTRRHEEESRNIKVTVWWDFENCTLPSAANVFKVAHSITAGIRANGIKGPIQITAFGDVSQLSRLNQEALSSTGITITHIPQGGKNSADRSLLVDLMYWVSQNPPPAHLLLISGDRDFASILHRLRMNNYNILLASPETAPCVLCSAASIMWHWSSLLKGENLIGKHFNQPPDGPYGSWYGHYRTPLEDPFAVTEQPSCSRSDELSDSVSDAKLRPVPKAVVKQIRHILNSYPNGISITELRSELGKSIVTIDKDLYGYRKFSRFLLAMPHVLQIQSGGEGQLFVHSIAAKKSETVNNYEEPGFTKGTKLNGEEKSFSKATAEKRSLLSSPEPSVKETPRKLQEPPLQESPSLVEKLDNAEINRSALHRVKEQKLKSEGGFLKKIWGKWFGSKGSDSENTRSSILEKNTSSSGVEIKNDTKKGEKHEKIISPSADPVARATFSPSSNGAVVVYNVAEGSESYDDKSRGNRGVLNQIISWCKFWRRNPNSVDSSQQSGENLNQTIVDSEKHSIFSLESFWNDMEAFIDTPKSSVLVLQSKTREQLAQNLKKQGPPVLKSLSENELLHLLDLLISEKKWVAECLTQSYPFKLIRPTKNCSLIGNPQSANGLRSIFSNESSNSNLQTLPEIAEKRNQNLPQNGVSPPVINKKSTGKSRSDALADCQKLVEDIVKEYPKGFNLGFFRKMFLERYGYPLDLQKIGFQKLDTLLQVMPGVKVESNFIVPLGKNLKRFNLESRLDDLESPWEELGPVSDPNPKKNEMELGLRRKGKEETMLKIHHGYEAPLDDDFSDSEEEDSPLTESEEQAKCGTNEEDSSLLQILDSWYSSKEGTDKKNGSEGVDGMVDCSGNGLKPSDSSGVAKAETPVAKNGRKQRPSRSYSFVSDDLVDNKDKLVDGILGSLKKSGESRIHS